MLAIESILADCGRLGMPWDEPATDESPDGPPYPDSSDDLPSMPSADWTRSARVISGGPSPDGAKTP